MVSTTIGREHGEVSASTIDFYGSNFKFMMFHTEIGDYLKPAYNT
jgi:hypothetical protein